MRRFRPGRRILGLAIAFLALSLGLWFLVGRPKAPVDSHETLRVMTYSSFMSAWGPGPEIAKRFKEKTGVTVEFQDAGDAGLILQKLKLFPVDLVVGLDEVSRGDAEAQVKWRKLEPIDFAPFAFVYRKGEIDPPTSLEDLLSTRFEDAIALEDPRTSAPGFGFLLWVIDELGEDKAFEFLAALKPNLHSVSPSWSTAYGAFKKKQAKLVFSYMTSPLYHLIEEKDSSYAAAVFTDGHVLQTEYAGVPETCTRCTDAEAFWQALREPEFQAIIMKKNYMLPVDSKVSEGTPFASLPTYKTREVKNIGELRAHRAELFERWRKLGL